MNLSKTFSKLIQLNLNNHKILLELKPQPSSHHPIIEVSSHANAAWRKQSNEKSHEWAKKENKKKILISFFSIRRFLSKGSKENKHKSQAQVVIICWRHTFKMAWKSKHENNRNLWDAKRKLWKKHGMQNKLRNVNAVGRQTQKKYELYNFIFNYFYVRSDIVQQQRQHKTH